MDFFSDSDSFSESSCTEEQDDVEILYSGQASNILSSIEDTIGKIDDFLSFERGYMYGDVVCSATDPSRQMGRVVNVDMFVDLENRHGQITKDVNSKILKKICSISVGDYVVHGPWLGKVDKVVDYITVLFDDGTKSEFTTMDQAKLLPVSSDVLVDSLSSFHPGQRVRVGLSSDFNAARWLCGTGNERQNEGTIYAVEAGYVYVDWLGCALVGSKRTPAPNCFQEPKNLTLLSCFSHAHWQLGHLCMLSPSEMVFNERISSNFPEIFEIVKAKTKVDVLWQDGSYSMGLDSHSVSPVNVVNAHDFFPWQFVLEKGIFDDPCVPNGQKWGVVTFVDAEERTVSVKWRSLAVTHAVDLEEEQMEEIVSAYELIEHPEYSYCLRDLVFRLEKDHRVDGQICRVCMSQKADLKSENCAGEQNILYNGGGYLSCIGIVVGLKDGNIEVKWAGGQTTEVAPYEIFRMDIYEGSSHTSVLHGENSEQLSPEMSENDQKFLHPNIKELLDSCFHSVSQAATGIFTGIMGSLFGYLGSTSLLGSSDFTLDERHGLMSKSKEDILESCPLCTERLVMAVCDLKECGETNLEQQANDNQDDSVSLFSSGSKFQEAFKQFDIVTGCLDHNFLDGASKGSTLSQPKRGWLRKVQQEWSILKKDLPETIYVRAYGERMDLLRAAIVGAPGTPYHDGLFFFDIFLPPEYPHEPPMVHYKSGGLCVNPNLYESGKVCLSLLNTWTGTGTEVWNPGCSSILQVLLSLQALVLNEKPYFNEAGYDKQMGKVEGEKNSASYNENAFLVSCKSMLYLLHNPPKHFESFVKEHFSRRSKSILLACKAYMEGAPVGCAFESKKGEKGNERGSSTGFKIMLTKLFPKLVESFSEKGIDCSQFC